MRKIRKIIEPISKGIITYETEGIGIVEIINIQGAKQGIVPKKTPDGDVVGIRRRNNKAYKDLKSITFIDDSVVKIYANTFEGCNLKEVVLPNSLFSIGKNAFKNNKQLEYLMVESDTLMIGDNAFKNVLKSINIDANKLVKRQIQNTM